MRRGYMHKVSVHLVQNIFSVISVLIVFHVANRVKGI